MSKDRDVLLDELLAKEDIRQLMLMYVLACDRDDAELLRKIYLPDARDNRGQPTGLASEHIDAMQRLRAGRIMIAHQTSNHLVWVDGDTAESEARNLSHAVLQTPDGYSYHVSGGRYLDKYRRDEQRAWRVAERVAVVDWTNSWPITETEARPRYGGTPSGAGDQTDPIYSFFGSLRRGELTI